MWPSSSMFRSVRCHRSSAWAWLTAGSQLVGLGMMPAIIAACDTVRSAAFTP
ncbi:Uncharacterised protein [Mycobacteroides abscessus]|nr:Uncharacterised protein [Mycobacteroides abscessus]